MFRQQLRSILTLVLATGFVASAPASAASVTQPNQNVGYVYQLDDAESFDFQVAGLISDCGSDLYRVRTTSAPILGRKFAMVLGAFLGDRKVTFSHEDVGNCEGNRKLIGWIRVVP